MTGWHSTSHAATLGLAFLQCELTLPQPTYMGSPKHKNRPARGPKGTLCPEWTHRTAHDNLGDDVFAHPWDRTEASILFGTALIDPANGRRFATARGIAFEAKPTADGTWHGYPIPWETVPDWIRRQWVEQHKVTRRDIKKHFSFDRRTIHWALVADAQ
jgi:hypothetical protein